MGFSNDKLLKFDIPEIIYGLGSLSCIGKCAERLAVRRSFWILGVADPGCLENGVRVKLLSTVNV